MSPILASFWLKPALTALSRRRLPQLDGHAYLPGLKDAVTVYRDRWGVPHIYATNRHDLLLAQGFVHAQDRLWQMDINRRVAKGQLAEILGERGLPTDRLTRTLGLARLASQSLSLLSQPLREELAAYSAGVNAYLETGSLPLEFTLLRYRPRPWQPVDTLALAHLHAWALTHGWAGELARAQLIAAIGPERAAEIEPIYPPEHPVTLPQGIEFHHLTLESLAPAAGPFLNRGADGGGRGSNAWLVSPRRSASGHALSGNDVHLPVGIPSLWYANHLCLEAGHPLSPSKGASTSAAAGSAPDFAVIGVSIPGVPYVLIGHNGQIAWGITLSYTDTEDLFIEQLAGPDYGRYLYQGEWRPTERFVEHIGVKGRPDHLEEVILTHHGPIVSNFWPGGDLGRDDDAHGRQRDGRHALALSSMALRPGPFFSSFAALNAASDWDSFTAALDQLATPALNVTYADRQGNIGYRLTGAIPVRARGSGLIPAPGWSGDYEWLDCIPPAEMPSALNPAHGYLINANNKIVADDYPHYLGQTWMNGYRARRLAELLDADERPMTDLSPVVGRPSLVALTDGRRFHFDFHSQSGLALARRLADHDPAAGDARLVWEMLQSWDGWLGPESTGGAVYQVLLAKLSRAILEPVIGPDLWAQLLGRGPDPLLVPVTEFYGHWSATLLRLLADPESSWLPARPQLLDGCLVATAVYLREKLGSDPARWQWGRLHQIRFRHPLSAQPPLDQIFDRGPWPIGGDTDTLGQTAVLPQAPYDNNAFSVSYWQLIDMGDLDSAQMMLAPGQSGQLGSPHYDDLIGLWRRGDSMPMLWRKEAVVMAAQHRLVLKRPL
jgi:penicillin G amidase